MDNFLPVVESEDQITLWVHWPGHLCTAAKRDELSVWQCLILNKKILILKNHVKNFRRLPWCSSADWWRRWSYRSCSRAACPLESTYFPSLHAKPTQPLNIGITYCRTPDICRVNGEGLWIYLCFEIKFMKKKIPETPLCLNIQVTFLPDIQAFFLSDLQIFYKIIFIFRFAAAAGKFF